MYNHLVKITYHENDNDYDSLYQKQLLEAFKLDSITSNELEKRMEFIHQKIKVYIDPLLEFIKDNSPYPFGVNKEDYVPILFAWEYFYLTHNVIKNVYENNENEIVKSVQILKNEMIKKLKK